VIATVTGGVKIDRTMSEASSSPSRMAATVESSDSEILRILMQTIPDRIYFKDMQSRFVRVNVAQAHLLGAASPEEVVGKTDADYFAPVHAESALLAEQEILRTGVAILGKTERITRLDGTEEWGSTSKLLWRDAQGKVIGTFGITRDITRAKIAEDKLTDERNLMRTIIDHLPSRIFVKDLESRFLINNEAHQKALGVDSQEAARGRTTLDFFAGERGEQAMADDRQVLSGGAAILGQEKSDFGPEGDTRWALTTKVPLRDSRGKLVGLVGISHDITARKRIEQELQGRTDEMETDFRMARQIQEVFFSRAYPVFPRGVHPTASALRFAHHYMPAASLGGDFFDVIQLSDTRCGVLVCDVMGHGVRAGLLTALIRGTVEEIGMRGQEPAHVLEEINRALIPIVQQTGQPVFATAFFGLIDTKAQTLLYANAGHPPPLVLRGSTGAMEQLALANPEPAAGLVDQFAYSQREIEFRPGDKLFGFTDGLFEAINSAGAMFGEEKLRALIQQSASKTCEELIHQLVNEVIAFTGRQNFDDDVCVLAVESVPVP
jgi:sigma-B regulation protein RsbU (phosphoserine phosphatase)